MTPGRIADEALRLTAESGLDGWTVRQLAASLDSYPAVVYHHVGDREAVVTLVIERVIDQIPQPVDDLGWRAWFQVLLSELRAVLRRYRGVARRFALIGPTVGAAGRLIDSGVRQLQEAGFGREAVMTYNLLVTTGCQLVAIEDDRDGTVAIRKRMAVTYAATKDLTDRPGLAAMGQFVHELAERPGGIEGYYASFYDYAIQRCFDGVEFRLTQLKKP